MTLPTQIPIRLRLTLWYVLLMAVSFAVFGVFLYARFQRSLLDTLDASLQLAAAQTIASFDVEEDLAESGQLVLEHGSPASAIAMRLTSPAGAVWGTYGDARVPWDAASPGLTTQSAGERAWRIFAQPIPAADGATVGWLQAAQSLETLTDTLEDFRDQLVWGIPFVLLLAGLGGYFLANRALRPIAQISTAAAEITAHDLSRRLDYRGPADEVGRLAHTFDAMLARLHDSFRRERRFTGDAAHELRTPLTVLKGQIEVTLSRPRPPAEYQAKLQELGTQVERLIRLSNALLFLSRSDQKQLSWNPAALNLAELLEVIVEQTQPLAGEKGIAVHLNASLDLTVFGDTDHLTRLFLNLLDNAIKYTPIGGRITLQGARAPEGVRVTLHNSGEGIPPEHLPHLFERFYRVQADRSSETGGVGLGLAISQEIVRLHGGEIRVESSPDQGVTVIVHLPDHS